MKILFRTILLLLLLTLLFVGTCWLYADQILDKFARPQIEKAATNLLAAKVQIRQLALTDNGLEILDLSVNVPGKSRVAIPRTELSFTLSSLWQRQFTALEITDPQLEFNQSQPGEESAKATYNLPKQLPLTINRLTVNNAQLLINDAGRQWQLHKLNLSGALQQKSRFALSAFFGPDQSHPVALRGSVELAPQQTLTLENFSWQGQALLRQPLLLKLAGTELALGRTVIQLDQFDQHKLAGILTALVQPSPLPEELSFSLSDLAITFSREDQTLTLELRVAKGLLGWNDMSGSFSQLKLLINRETEGWRAVAQLHGPARSTLSFTGLLTADNQLSGQAQLEIPEPDQLKTMLLGGSPLKISGGLQLSAEYSLQGNRLQLTTQIRGTAANLPSNDYLLNIGHLNGEGKLLLADNNQDFSLNLRLASQPFFAADGTFSRLTFSLNLPRLQDLEKLLAAGQIPEQIQSATGIKLGGQLSRNAAAWSGKLSLNAAEISLPELNLSRVVGQAKVQLAAGQVSFQETALDCGIARGDELKAQVTVQLAGKISPQRFSLALQQLSLAHLNYMSADGQTGVGEAALEVQGTIDGPWPEGPIALNLKGSVAAQEVLAGAFYADLSAYKGSFLLNGDLAASRKELHATSFRIEFPQLGSLTAAGRFSPEQLSLESHVQSIELAESYGKQLSPLLSGLFPAVTELTLTGRMALDTSLFWTPDGWLTHGALQLRGLDAYWKRQRVEIVAATGDIPFAVSAGKVPDAADLAAQYPGDLSFATLAVGLASLKDGQLLLTATPNRFKLRSPLLLQLAGGQVTMANLNLGWQDGAPQGSVKIEITEVELEALTKELGLPVMQGRLSADLGTIHYADRQLKTDGIASIEVFGGRFRLSNMRYLAPFSSYPTFHTDIELSGLDLLQATRTFDFGEMNGVLDGQIRGLELFGKTPAAFEATLATRAEGKRNISVKALNNLSILSQGGISAALSRGIYRFIDFYRYRQIGIKCSLENDTFTLLGTALPGSNRYLVHGGLLPPRIDITSSTPTISFKEMVKRLGRIERAGH